MREHILEAEKDRAGQKSRNFGKATAIWTSILLFMTFFSKSLYNYRLPEVVAMQPKEGKFVYTAEGTSELTYAHTDSVYAETDGRIREILAKAGEQIKTGQCLMRLEVEETGEMLDITALKDGIITRIDVEEGMYVSSRQNIVLYEIAGEPEKWICSLTVSEEQAEHIRMDSVPVLHMISRDKKIEGQIQSIIGYVGQDQKGYMVTVEIRDADASVGERARIVIEQESVLYESLIPVSALCRDLEGYYVLVIREDDSVLGRGYRACRMSVDLLESDEIYCAVRGIPSDEYVIVSATDEIWDGSSVFYEGI